MFNINLTKVPLWRHILELSNMSNNDQIVFFTTTKGEADDIIQEFISKKQKTFCFSLPRVVLQRAVFNIEIEEGLKPDIKSFIQYENEEKSEVTILLDELFKFMFIIDFYNQIKDHDAEDKLSFLVANIIGSNYYDCLSAGVSREWILLMRQLIKIGLEKGRVRLEEEVYPRPDSKVWYTIKDFLESTANVEKTPSKGLKLLESRLFLKSIDGEKIS